jgi:hypothetical protein
MLLRLLWNQGERFWSCRLDVGNVTVIEVILSGSTARERRPCGKVGRKKSAPFRQQFCRFRAAGLAGTARTCSGLRVDRQDACSTECLFGVGEFCVAAAISVEQRQTADRIQPERRPA